MIIGNISRGQRINEAWQRDYAKNVKIHIFDGGHRMSTSIINLIAETIRLEKT